MNRLSHSFKFFQYLIAALTLVLFAGWIHSIRLNLQGIKKDGLVELPIFVLIGCLILYLIRRMKNIHFDSNALYIKIGKNNKVIPLENIFEIKMIVLETGEMHILARRYVQRGSRT
jgi:hypothetical protein